MEGSCCKSFGVFVLFVGVFLLGVVLLVMEGGAILAHNLR